MARTTHATFDGRVLHLEDTTGLEVNKRYRVTLEEEAPPPTPEQAAEQQYGALLDIANDLGITGFADKPGKK